MSPTSRTFWFLVVLFAASIWTHVTFFDGGLHRLATTAEYGFEQSVEITGAVGRFELELRIPTAGRGLEIRDENFETADLDLEVNESEAGRFVVVSGPGVVEERHLRYRGQFRSLSLEYRLDPGAGWPRSSPGDSLWLSTTEEIQTLHPEIGTLLAGLFGIAAADSVAEATVWDADRWQATLAALGIGPMEALQRIYDHAWQGLDPATFSGTTDALTALRLGEASCGGKSRLMVALCRRLGLPSRIVGGVMMTPGPRKRAHHLWVEVRLGDEWIPFDPLNGYFATRPAHFLELYRGDLPLIRHTRGLTFDYGFRSTRQRVPLVWLGSTPRAEGAESVIPILDRRGFSALILAPVCLLLIVFARQVVGLDSIGTFLPILLGYSLIHADWVVTGAQMLLTVLLGVLIRFVLGRLNLLHVPRTAVMITFVVLVFLVFSAGLSRYDSAWGVGAVVLPIAALAMAIEKFTLVAMDKGTGGALALLIQTLILAAGCRAVMVTPFFRNLVVAFPETLLLVLAAIVMLGQYRGLRWREWWRFRHVGVEGAS